MDEDARATENSEKIFPRAVEIISGGEKIVAQMENPGREAILSRIRAALAKPAKSHTAKSGGEIFFPMGDALDRFQKECTINNTECLLTESLAASSAAIAEIIMALPAGPIFLQDAPILRRLAPTLSGDRNIRWSTEGIPAED